MLRRNFCRSDGRLVKLFLFSTLLDTSPLTSIYFASFENKREVRSPLPTQSKFLIFGKFSKIEDIIYYDQRIKHLYITRTYLITGHRVLILL